jgi:hypothetical protein
LYSSAVEVLPATFAVHVTGLFGGVGKSRSAEISIGDDITSNCGVPRKASY